MSHYAALPLSLSLSLSVWQKERKRLQNVCSELGSDVHCAAIKAEDDAMRCEEEDKEKSGEKGEGHQEEVPSSKWREREGRTDK